MYTYIYTSTIIHLTYRTHSYNKYFSTTEFHLRTDYNIHNHIYSYETSSIKRQGRLVAGTPRTDYIS